MEILIKSKDGNRRVNLNRRKSIHQKCLDCCCWQPSAVTKCPFTKCDLHLFRTGRGKQNAKDRTKSIKLFCLNCMNGQTGEVSKCGSTSCSLFPFHKRCSSSTIIHNDLTEINHAEAVL